MNRASFAWIAKCGLGALVLLLACRLAAVLSGNHQQLPAVTTRDGTLMTMNRYVAEPIPDIVLLGSSLTFRLKEEYFSERSLRNLALAGGSPITSLAIVANQPRLPRLILVETNVLTHNVDDALVERYSRKVGPLFIRPVRAAVGAYEGWMHAPLTHEQVAQQIESLLAEPPSAFDNQRHVDRVVRQGNAEDPTNAVRDSIDRLKPLIAAVEQKGARVLLFELPLPEAVEGTRYARITREAAHAAFPDPSRWLALKTQRDQLRWADGFHLDERSAIVLAQSMEKALDLLAASR